jgi:hypothetical protein
MMTRPQKIPPRAFHAACSGKIAYHTEAAAGRVARAMRRAGADRPEQGELVHYLCQWCGKFHTGHRDKGV